MNGSNCLQELDVLYTPWALWTLEPSVFRPLDLRLLRRGWRNISKLVIHATENADTVIAARRLSVQKLRTEGLGVPVIDCR